MQRRTFVSAIFLATLALILAACSTPQPASVSVSIVAPTTTIAIDGRTRLAADVSGTSNLGVTWTSNNPSVVSVDSNGLVEAQNVTGSALITATSVADPSKSDSVTITVGNFSVSSITISGPTSVQVGSSITLAVTVVPSEAPQKAIWTSDATGIATVDRNGVVSGVSEGTATITALAAADTSVSDSIVVTVTPSGGGGTVTSVTIDNPPPGNTIPIGVTRDLDATVTGTGSFTQNVTWSSSQPSVATIDSATGEVTGVATGTTEITAASDDDPSVTDSFDLTVAAVADCSSPTTLASVNADTSLPFGCYLAASNVTITADLVFAPGSIIEVSQGSRIVVSTGGSLNAVGTPTQPITFRGVNAFSGFWDGLEFNALNGANVLDYVEISDAGSGGYGGVYVNSSGSVSLTNSTISGSSIAFHAQTGGVVTNFADNVFSGNDLVADMYASQIDDLDSATDYAGSTGTPNTNNYLLVRGGTTTGGTWPATNAPFRSNGDITVSGAVDVTPGAAFEFGPGYRLIVNSTGSFRAIGTGADPIVIRGSSPNPGHWDGIEFVSNSPNNVVDFVEIRDAGSGGYGGVYVNSAGGVDVTNTTITNSSIGLHLQTGAVLNAFANNVFSGNDLVADMYASQIDDLDSATDYAGSTGTPNTNNYLLVRGGTTTGGTWPATNAPFRTNGDITVNGGVDVTPGATIEFGANDRLIVNTTGSLNATGTSGDRIVFRGATATTGLWDGIEVRANNPNNVLDFVDVLDGGADGYSNLYVSGTGGITVTNSSFSNSGRYGIWVRSGGTITPGTEAALTDPGDGNNTFSNNTLGPTFGLADSTGTP